MEQLAARENQLQKYDELRQRIVEIWKAFVLEKEKKGEWRDSSNRPNLTMSCEAIETLLIPLQYERNLSVDLAKIYPFSDIRKDIEGIIQEVNEKGFYVHEDYLDEGFSRLDKAEWPQNLDTASFCLTSLVHFKHAYENEISGDTALNASINESIEKALRFIRDCRKKGGGWSFAPEDKTCSFLYMSHSAIEGLRDIIDPAFKNRGYIPASCNDVVNELQSDMSETRQWVEDEFLDENKVNQYMIDKQIEFNEMDRSYYYNLYATLILLENGSKHPLVRASVNYLLGGLSEVSSTREFINAIDQKYTFALEGKKGGPFDLEYTARYIDQAGIPYLLKMLVLFLKGNPHLNVEYEQYIPTAMKALDALRMKGSPLWRKDTFKIYYCERAVEALSAVMGYYKERSKESDVAASQSLSMHFSAESIERLKDLLEIETLFKRVSSLEERVLSLSSLEERVDSLSSKLGELIEPNPHFTMKFYDDVRKYLRTDSEKAEGLLRRSLEKGSYKEVKSVCELLLNDYPENEVVVKYRDLALKAERNKL